MQVDLPTLYVVGGLFTATQGLLLLYYWFGATRSRALLLWSAALAVDGVGRLAAYGLDWTDHRHGAMLIPAAELLAYAIIWQGTRVFAGRSAGWLPLTAPLLWCALVAARLLGPGDAIYLSVAFALAAVTWGAIAAEFWRVRGGRLPTRGLLLAFSIILAVVNAAEATNVIPSILPAHLGLRWDYAGFIFSLAMMTTFALLAMAIAKEAIYREAETAGSVRDAVTGLLARGTFMVRTQQILRRRKAERSPVCLLLVDVMGASASNDVDARDLRRFGRLIERELQAVDIAGRLGGPSFACLLCGVSPAEAAVVGERILINLALAETEVKWRLAAGVASTVQVGHDMAALSAAAFAALGQSRQDGIAQVVVYYPGLQAESPGQPGGRSQVIAFTRRRG